MCTCEDWPRLGSNTYDGKFANSIHHAKCSEFVTQKVYSVHVEDEYTCIELSLKDVMKHIEAVISDEGFDEFSELSVNAYELTEDQINNITDLEY